MAFAKELRLAFRTLARNPGFSTLSIATLAIGIGAATLVFSVTNSVLWRPLAFPRSNQLVEIAEHNPSRPWQTGASGPNFLDWRDRNQNFESMAAMSWASARNLTAGDFTARVFTSAVSSGFFETLGIAPALGRSF